MKKRRIKVKCPFCTGKKFEHTYRTYHGFYRHVFNEHALTKNYKHLWDSEISPDIENIGYLRKYYLKYSRFQDYKVHGKKHVQAIIEVIASNQFNPSLRIPELLEKALEETKCEEDGKKKSTES